MSDFDTELDNENAICPYCQYHHYVEPEDYDEDERQEVCDGCGKKFWHSESFSVDIETRPDCELNGEDHSFELITSTAVNRLISALSVTSAS